jgi:(R,R)-butanediol dehydrogenase/meso-butanediol dehydrogenase/diacetyl reductase
VRAVRWHGPRDVRVDDVPEPGPPGPGEVKIAVEWVGICGTDREEWRSGPHWMQVGGPHPGTGRMAPITLGHEVSARVVEVGNGVSGLTPDELVAIDGLSPCGRCWWCQRHQYPLCDSFASIGMHADGGLADFMTVPAAGCIPVADHVGSDTAALAEPIAVAVRGLRRGRFVGGESVVVFGAGMVGLGAVAAARAYGARTVAVVAPSEARRTLASSLGADVAIDSGSPDLADRMVALNDGRGPDLVIEASGHSDAALQAVSAPRKGGRTVILGFPTESIEVDLATLAIAEREVIGSLSHVWDEDFRAAVSLLERGAVTADQVVSARIPLEDTVAVGFESDDWKNLPGAKILVAVHDDIEKLAGGARQPAQAV